MTENQRNQQRKIDELKEAGFKHIYNYKGTV